MEGNVMPRTIEEIFKDFKGRRAGLIKALTTDVEEFYQQCDPDKDNLCLYGNPDESWEVNLPAEEVPPELPEPALGINFPRDGLERREWLSLVAVHSDVWLLAVSSFYSARFDRNERKRLFNMINELPTVLEVVSGRRQTQPPPPQQIQQVKEKSTSSNGTKSKQSSKSGKPSKHTSAPVPKEEEDTGEDEEEENDTFCGICDGPYTSDEFWIGCDICEKWYHGKCVKITPAKAEHINQYKCPACVGNKRPRP